MKLEKSTPEDAKECVAWMRENLMQNDCSPKSLKGCTFWKITGVFYLPVKPVLLLESLAPNPAVAGTKRLLALRRAMDDLRKIYPNVEILFYTRGNTRLDKCAKSYGFEEVPFSVYRLLDPAACRAKAQASKKALAQARLRSNPRAIRGHEAKAAGSVPGLREGTISGKPPGAGPHSRNQDCAGSSV
jgi:hypothetical protein